MSKALLPPCALVVALLAALPAARAAQRITSDLAPPAKRQTSVELAEALAKRPPPAPLPADLLSPFNPADFDKPDTPPPPPPGEKPVAAAPTGTPGRPTTAPAPTTPEPSAPSDRQTLEMLAAQITPSGVIQLRGAYRIILHNKQFEVGTRFTATYNNQDYDLELVAIDRTTFTLRYRGEEVTRPIRPVR